MSVIVTNIYLRKDTPSRVPRAVRRLFLRGDVAKPCQARSVPLPPPPPPPPTLNGKMRQSAAAGRDGDLWTIDGQAFDDVELTVQRPARRVVNSIHLSDVDDDLNVLDRRQASQDRALFSGGPHRHAHKKHHEAGGSRCAAGSDEATEWQELARIVDRLFFWLFMVSSIGLLSGLYASIAKRSTSINDNTAP